MDRYTVSIQYDIDSCEFVENVVYTSFPPATYRGRESVLSKAAEFEISPREAVQSRLRYLIARRGDLERKEWGCHRQAERLGCGPMDFTRASDVRRALHEYPLIERFAAISGELCRIAIEIESLTGYLRGEKQSPHTVTEDQKGRAHRADVRKVLEAADIKVRGNGMLKCPFHKDRDESASIAKGVLVCFAGCTPGEESTKRYWDAVALYRRLFEVDYFTAVRGVLAL